MPDPVTPIEETAKAFDEAYSNGHFQLVRESLLNTLITMLGICLK